MKFGQILSTWAEAHDIDLRELRVRTDHRIRKVLSAALISTMIVIIGPAVDLVTAPAASAAVDSTAALNVARNTTTNDPFTITAVGSGNFAIYVELVNPASGQYLTMSTTFTNVNDYYGQSSTGFTKALFIGTQTEINNTFVAGSNKLKLVTGGSANPNTSIRWKIDPWDSSYQYSTNTHHFYKFITVASTSWSSAATTANGATFVGAKGYLATVSTATENADVVTAGVNVGATSGAYWFGAGDNAMEGVWRWTASNTNAPESGKIFYTQYCVKNNGTYWNTTPTSTSCADNASSLTTPQGALYTYDNFNYANWNGSSWNGTTFTAGNNGEPNNADGTSGEDFASFIMNSDVRGKWNDLRDGNTPNGYIIEYGEDTLSLQPSSYTQRAITSFTFDTGYSALTTTYGTSVYSTTPATSGGRSSVSYSINNSGHPAVTINSSTGVVTLSTAATTADNGSYTVTATENSGTSGDAFTTTTTIAVTVSKLTLSTPGSLSVTATSGVAKSISVSWADIANDSGYTVTLLEGATLRATIPLSTNATSKVITTADYSGLADNTTYTVNVVAVGNATQYETSTAASSNVTTNQAARTGTFGSPTRQSLSFTVALNNYDNTFIYETATSSAGYVTFNAGTFVVTGLTRGAGATVSISTRKSGFASTTTTSSTYYALDTATTFSITPKTLTVGKPYKILTTRDLSNPNSPVFTTTTSSICTISGETVTPIAAGACAIKATLVGYSNYDSATAYETFTVSSALSLTVPATKTVYYLGPNNFQTFSYSGGLAPYTFSILRTSDSSTPSGFSITSSYISMESLTPVSSDTYTVIVTDANGASLNALIYIIIGKAYPTFGLTANVETTTFGLPITFTITTSSPNLTGSFSLKENSGGATLLTGCTNLTFTNGSATCTWISDLYLTAGVVVAFAGDSNYSAANYGFTTTKISIPALITYNTPFSLVYNVGASYAPFTKQNGTTIAGTPWTWSIIRESDSQTVSGISMNNETITVASTVPVGSYVMRVYSTDSVGSTTSRLVTINVTAAAGTAPTLGAVTRTSGGFRSSITNFSADSIYTLTVTAGSVETSTAVGSSQVFTVSGLNDSATATVTVSVARANYTTVSNTVSGTALAVGINPSFGSITKTSGGFTVSISNYNAGYTWTESVTAGTVTAGTPSGSNRTYTIAGLTPGQSSTLYVSDTSTTTKLMTSSISGSSLDSQSPITVTKTSGTYPSETLTASGGSGTGTLTFALAGPSTASVSGTQVSKASSSSAYSLYSPDGTMLYILSSKTPNSTLARLDVASNTFLSDISLPATSNQMAIAPDGSYILVVSTTQVTKVLTSTGETSTVISSGITYGLGISIDPTGTGDFYISDANGRKILGFYSNGTSKFSTQVNLNAYGTESTSFGRSAISSNGQKLYVIGTGTDGALYVFNASTGAKTDEFAVTRFTSGLNSIALASNSQYVFMTNSSTGRVYKVDLTSRAVTSNVILQNNNYSTYVSVSPDSSFVIASVADVFNTFYYYRQYATSDFSQIASFSSNYASPASSAIAPDAKTGFLIDTNGIRKITFAWGSGSAKCAISGTSITAQSAGTCLVIANKAADVNYLSETSTNTAFTFNGAPALTVRAVAGTVNYKPTSQYTASALLSGFVSTDSATISTITYTYLGINGTTYASSSTKPVSVGTYSVTPSASTFSFSSGYQAGYATPINYVADTLTVQASVPDSPTVLTVSNVTSTTASIAFTPPINTGGVSITSYLITNGTDTATAMGASSPITVTGLTPGSAYTFKVNAINSAGRSDTATATQVYTKLGITLSPSTVTGYFGTPITNIVPTVVGGSGITYSVTPTLPAGLSIDSSGVISGTPTETKTVTSYTETATYGSYTTGSATFSLTILKGDASITTPTISPATPTLGAALTFTSTVTSVNSRATLTGTVDFKNGSNTVLCTTSTITAGVASCSYTPLTTDTFTVRAVYSGMTYVDSATSSALTVVPTKANPTLAITATSPNVIVNSAVTLTATLTTGTSTASTGSVAFTSNSAALTGCTAATISTNAATCLFTPTATGSYVIGATYTGDNNYNSAVATTYTITVSLCTQSYTGITLATGVPAAGYCAVSITSGAGSYGLPANVTSMTTRILIIGGGGSGGTRAGAGGGAGAVLYTDSFTVTDTKTVSIGPGGASLNYSNHGESGTATTFGTYVALAGGGGAKNNSTVGYTGGSGGGGAGTNGGTAGGASQSNYGGLFTAYVKVGGIGTSGNTGPDWTGGGGGGAGGVGGNGVGQTRGGTGGAGLAFNMTLDGTYACFAAGGGGGTDYPKVGGSGGSCIGNSTAKVGGDGSAGGTSPDAGAGAPNTGSGGGGAGFGISGDDQADTGRSGAGGSGLVAIRYISAPSITISGDQTVASLTSVTLSATVPTFSNLFTRTYQWQKWDSATSTWRNETSTALTYTFVAHYNGSSVQKYRLLVRDTDGTLQTTTTSPVVNLTVTPLTQPTFYIASTYGIAGAGIVLYTAGGAGTGAVTYTYVATGSAAGCSLVGTTLTLLTSGVCKVIATKAGDLDYVLKVSDTATVSFVSFQVAAQIAPTNTSTGISTSGSTTTTKGSNSCSSNCVPRIDSLSSYTGHIGDSITLTGENFSGATKVIFNVFTNAATYSVVSDTSLTVTIPASLPTGETGIEVVTPNGTSPRNYDFEIVP